MQNLNAYIIQRGLALQQYEKTAPLSMDHLSLYFCLTSMDSLLCSFGLWTLTNQPVGLLNHICDFVWFWMCDCVHTCVLGMQRYTVYYPWGSIQCTWDLQYYCTPVNFLSFSKLAAHFVFFVYRCVKGTSVAAPLDCFKCVMSFICFQICLFLERSPS